MFQKSNVNSFALNQRLKSFNRGIGIMRKNIKTTEGADAREQQIAFLKMQKPVTNKSTVTALLKNILDTTKNSQLERTERNVMIEKQLKQLDDMKKDLLFRDVDELKKVNEQIKTITSEAPVLDLYINNNEQEEFREFKQIEKNMERLYNQNKDPIIQRELDDISEQLKITVEDGSKARFRETNKTISSRIASLERAMKDTRITDTHEELKNVADELANTHLHALKIMINLGNINNTNGNDVWHAIDRNNASSIYVTLKKYNQCWKTFVKGSEYYIQNVNPYIANDPRQIENQFTELRKIIERPMPNKSTSRNQLVRLFKQLRADTVKLIDWYQSAINDGLISNRESTSMSPDDYHNRVDDNHVFLDTYGESSPEPQEPYEPDEPDESPVQPPPYPPQSAEGRNKRKQKAKGSAGSDYYVIKFK